MAKYPPDKRPPPTPKAPKPWDIPLPPAQGDSSPEVIFEAVGRALNIWNEFEESLAEIFAALVTDDDFYPAIHAYGSIITFRGRKEMIEATAEAFFFLHPEWHTTIQARLESLLESALNFSARRNEIAHGVVYENRTAPEGWPLEKYLAHGILAPESLRPHAMRPLGFVLRPSEISLTKNEMEKGQIAIFPVAYIPKYVYSSAEIIALSKQFKKLKNQANRFPLALLQYRSELKARS